MGEKSILEVVQTLSLPGAAGLTACTTTVGRLWRLPYTRFFLNRKSDYTQPRERAARPEERALHLM